MAENKFCQYFILWQQTFCWNKSEKENIKLNNLNKKKTNKKTVADTDECFSSRHNPPILQVSRHWHKLQSWNYSGKLKEIDVVFNTGAILFRNYLMYIVYVQFYKMNKFWLL